MQVEPFVIAGELAAATVYTGVASVVSKNTHKNVLLPSTSGIRYKIDKV